MTQMQMFETKELGACYVFVEKLVKETLAKLEEEEPFLENFVSWELRTYWIQHLQVQSNTEKDKETIFVEG